MWVMGEWAVGYWIMGVTSFQKIYGLYGLKHHIVEISGDVTKAGRDKQTNKKERYCYSAFDLCIAEFRNFFCKTGLPNRDVSIMCLRSES